MKPGSSTLNPHASSYVPLSKRVAVDKSKDSNILLELQNENEAVWLGHQPGNTQGQFGNVSSSYLPNAGAFQSAEISKWKDRHAGVIYASSSYYQNNMPERSNSDEESDMDLAYLQMTFPGISEESISEAYMANRGDLDATVDMLNHLEHDHVDFSEKLPDTLDIEDVPEPGSFGDFASLKQKSVAGEAGSSMSSPSLPSASSTF
ncbi:polyadenylate-binding protein-interacting protein 6-like [Primulina huaijiensis]|uniref:polyadenylate-binding protein-interacting protein 6-like n=1 Tax=Primulina huaijiensis TaxID=1492673 RepID=UPI003CC75B3A